MKQKNIITNAITNEPASMNTKKEGKTMDNVIIRSDFMIETTC